MLRTTGQKEKEAVSNVVFEWDTSNIGEVAYEFCESHVKESKDIRKETFKEAELKEATEVRRGTALK